MSKAQCTYGMVVKGRVHAMCALPEGHQTEVRTESSVLRWFNGHRLMLTNGQYLNAPYRCEHCGRPCGDLAGGYAVIGGHRVCHPNAKDRPDCYRLITVYHEVIGVRLSEVELREV